MDYNNVCSTSTTGEVAWARGATINNAIEFKKHFNRCVAIIDCFEVFCERAKSLKARAQTWSNYKHNTVKVFLQLHYKELFHLCRKAGVAVLQINILLKTVASLDTYFQEIRS